MNELDPYFAVDAGSKKAARTRHVTVLKGSDFAASKAPERHFHVNPLIPGSTVSILGGDGGTGKSLLALQLAVATAIDGKWCGLSVSGGPVLYLSAEDDAEEIHRRLEAIAEAADLDLADLDRLRIVPLAGQDAVLAAPDARSNILKRTPLFATIEDLLVRHVPALVIVDTLADVFGGAENERSQSRQFIGLLRGWALTYRTAVLLLAHPSLTGMASGSGSSGSTAWNNSVRSRLYLDRIKGEDGFESDPDARVLRTVKANYGRTGDEIRLRWQEGVFVTVDNEAAASAFGAMAAAGRVDRLFMTMLGKHISQGRNVSPHPTSNNFGPTVFARHDDANGTTRRAFEAALNRLFAAGLVVVSMSKGAPSRQKEVIAFAPPGGTE